MFLGEMLKYWKYLSLSNHQLYCYKLYSSGHVILHLQSTHRLNSVSEEVIDKVEIIIDFDRI